jgi:hypothetical protein
MDPGLNPADARNASIAIAGERERLIALIERAHSMVLSREDPAAVRATLGDVTMLAQSVFARCDAEFRMRHATDWLVAQQEYARLVRRLTEFRHGFGIQPEASDRGALYDLLTDWLIQVIWEGWQTRH